LLVFHCTFCGFNFSQANGPFVWIQPQCPNCGSNVVNMSDESDQPEYDMDELLEWAEIGRQALAGEGEEVEVPSEEELELKVQPVGGLLGKVIKKIKRE